MSLIDRWISQLNGRIPFVANSSQTHAIRLKNFFRDELHDLSYERQALLWLSIGEINAPHEMVQNESTSCASYLHGIVHRLEGYYGNSLYWFHRVHDKKLLSHVNQQVIENLQSNAFTECAQDLKILKQGEFTPAQFVNVCQQSKESDREFLERVGYAEWLALWNFVA